VQEAVIYDCGPGDTNLHVNVEGKDFSKGVNLVVKQGETHALMGLTAPARVRWPIP